jgi:hypothetical protein
MVNRDKRNSTLKNANSDQYSLISETISPRNSKNRSNTINDDVIMSLTDAYENKRARQVSEWEHMRRFMRHAA